MLNKQCSCNIIKSYIMMYFLFLLLSFFSVGASAQDVIEPGDWYLFYIKKGA